MFVLLRGGKIATLRWYVFRVKVIPLYLHITDQLIICDR